MTEEQIKAAIESAITALKAENPPLDFSKTHERATAHRLAVHMEPLFDGWNVDCEYDRDELIKKILDGIRECTGNATDAIFPDIIVHKRGLVGTKNNLLVIELKKDSAEDPCDKRKLELLTSQDGHYQYQLGLYINIDSGTFTRTWYKDGQKS